jgi:hypothetical protein
MTSSFLASFFKVLIYHRNVQKSKGIKKVVNGEYLLIALTGGTAVSAPPLL